jgi:hypothetical protein
MRPMNVSGIQFYWPEHYLDTASKGPAFGITPELSEDPKTACILIFGQSNAANEGAGGPFYVCQEKVYNFNYDDGKIYLCGEPLLGCSGWMIGWPARFADLLIQSGKYDTVILVPIAQGGSFLIQWSKYGILGIKLAYAIRQTQRAGLKITHLLLQQGEAESGHGVNRFYRDYFGGILGIIRDNECEAPLYIAQCSRTREGINEQVREAQLSVVDGKDIFRGPDVDTVLERCDDGLHFNRKGLDEVARLWAETL